MQICVLENNEKLRAELSNTIQRMMGGYWNANHCFTRIQLILEGRASLLFQRQKKYKRISARFKKRIDNNIKKFKKQFKKYITDEVRDRMNIVFGDTWVKHAYTYINNTIHYQYMNRLLTKMPALEKYKEIRDFKLKYKRKVKRGPGRR